MSTCIRVFLLLRLGFGNQARKSLPLLLMVGTIATFAIRMLENSEQFIKEKSTTGL